MRILVQKPLGCCFLEREKFLHLVEYIYPIRWAAICERGTEQKKLSFVAFVESDGFQQIAKEFHISVLFIPSETGKPHIYHTKRILYDPEPVPSESELDPEPVPSESELDPEPFIGIEFESDGCGITFYNI